MILIYFLGGSSDSDRENFFKVANLTLVITMFGRQVHKMHIVIAKYVTTYGFKVQVNLNIYCTNQPKVCKLCSE